MSMLVANGLHLAFEDEGPRDAPPVVLVAGLGCHLTWWPRPFLRGLLDAGLRVIRFDNRDVGLSDKLDQFGRPDIGRVFAELMSGRPSSAPYTLADMAADTAGLIQALDLGPVHLVGVSMGGAITQTVAGLFPQVLKSAVPIMATSGRPGLSDSRPGVREALLIQPDPGDETALIENGLNLRRIIGNPGYPADETWLRGHLLEQVRRDYHPAGTARQFAAIIASGSRAEMLPKLALPMLVLHGEDDPLLPLDHGRDIAALVPGARFIGYPGMGHDIPPQLSGRIAADIAGFVWAVR